MTAASGVRRAAQRHLRTLGAAATVARVPLAATGSPDGRETLVDLRTVRKVFEDMKPREFTAASGPTVKTHDLHFELVQTILVHGAGKTRKARRKLRLALRRAGVNPEA